MKMKLFLVTIVISMSILSCREKAGSHQYIFLGHPYDWNAPDKVDPRLEQLNYADFDQIWLGGDICSHLTAKPQTLDEVDRIFDLDAPETLWTLGNHDVLEGNEEWIQQHTGRPSFYSVWQDGICILVLNTNLFWYYKSTPPQVDCEQKEAQLSMIQQVTDTIQKASHLVILHHLALMSDLRRNEQGVIPDSFNINPGIIYPSCDSSLTLTHWLYPKLQAVKERGIDVVLVGGDFGMRAEAFEYYLPDSICMLGSGINNSLKPQFAPEYVTSFGDDKILIFTHHPERRQLSWEFVDLDSLVQVNAKD